MKLTYKILKATGLTYGDIAEMVTHFGIDVKQQTLTNRVNTGILMSEKESEAFKAFLLDPPKEWTAYAYDIKTMFTDLSQVYSENAISVEDVTFDNYEVPITPGIIKHVLEDTSLDDSEEFLMDQPLDDFELNAEIDDSGTLNVDEDDDDLFDLGEATDDEFQLDVSSSDDVSDSTVNPDAFDFDKFINS